MASVQGNEKGQRAKYAKRLSKEYKKLKENPPEYASVSLVKEDDPSHWRIVLHGPADTPWDGGKFVVDLQTTAEYPMKVPHVSFVTPIFHPNVDKTSGEICQNIIEKDWSPVLKIKDVLEKLQDMLKNPQGDAPVDAEVGELYNSNRSQFNSAAKSWTKKHAK